eukprot:gene23581-23617_t
MTLPLSILDLSTIQAGATPAEAIRRSVELARAADALGYRRYWVAEHHSTDSHAGTAPEVLIAALTQATSRIRLGSGAVLLANYSPLKVVEQFMTLEALAPGRIDLGIGRAIGGDELTGQALRTAGLQSFPTFFSLLQSWLLDAGGKQPFPLNHPAKGVRAQPWGRSHPDLFVLCSSSSSAAIAGQPVRADKAMISLSASMGVTTIRADDSTVTLFKRADGALQQAMLGGANRVVEAPDLTIAEE